MKIGLCAPVENASALVKAAFDYVEENVQNFLIPEESDAAFAAKLDAAKRAELPVLAANCFIPSGLKCTGPAVDRERLERYAETAFRRAQQVGIRFIVFGSGGSRQIPDGFDRAQAQAQFISLAKSIAPVAERHGVTIVVEPLNKKECNFINSLADGAAVVEAVNHPHLRLLADFYHMSMEGESPDEIVRHGRWLAHAHVAELADRMAPGTKGEDFGPYLRALKKINYGGAISYECGWRDFPEQAAESLKGFRAQLREAGLG
jgi:sugar phosphate isomerase/epimerase